ncbi:MAG: GtrA family protein [Candidatus Contendobacter sp.]|nr:GtrA family protein [Candidatus Contendobacter sp.]MDS4059578.1 GtrA family protein [Candidatus Contendobacter sp.]
MTTRSISIRARSSAAAWAAGTLALFCLTWAWNRAGSSSANTCPSFTQSLKSALIVNNLFIYRDQRLTGRCLLGSLSRFHVACGIGTVVNAALADFLFKHGVDWRFAGIAGTGVDAMWNYVMTSPFTWSSRSAVTG